MTTARPTEEPSFAEYPSAGERFAHWATRADEDYLR